ncbi:MAG: UDP-3-O-acyl-N-acetylglucosamine deacetylase, partial [Caulobacterales bacterium]|nr:UDP-3-O-acyl-N-acetylglucosamine deacetylase [Caulobacterales bacterium]
KARTFGFLHQVETMRKNGLSLGGSLNNAVVIDGDEIMNDNGLRYDDEFVRHKALDAVGDLSLCGAALNARYIGHQSGHALNVALVKALLANPQNWRLTSSPLNAQMLAAAGI